MLEYQSDQVSPRVPRVSLPPGVAAEKPKVELKILRGLNSEIWCRLLLVCDILSKIVALLQKGYIKSAGEAYHAPEGRTAGPALELAIPTRVLAASDFSFASVVEVFLLSFLLYAVQLVSVAYTILALPNLDSFFLPVNCTVNTMD